MPKISPSFKIFLIFVIYLFLGYFTQTRAIEIFSDSFSGGYSNSWQVAPNSLAPIPSTHGISAADNFQWSDIWLPVNENINYDIKFDLWINSNNVNSAWRLYIINSSSTNYKIINNWGPSNQLQISEFQGIDSLHSWSHGIGVHHFEIIFSPVTNTYITVIEDNIEIARELSNTDFSAAYINVGLLGNGDYEMSNFVLSTADVSSSPTPTSTAQPTPTPTPTPTATPTPQTIPTTKMIVIPGMGGSWNKQALMNCEPSTSNQIWVPMDGTYDRLISSLRKDGYAVIPLYYDWRLPPSQLATKLSERIQNALGTDEKINIVAHSYGGLVARSYIEQTQSDARINALLTVGTPHAGGVDAYLTWAGGDLHQITEIQKRFQLEALIHFCGITRHISPLEALHTYAPSLQYILPTFNYLRSSTTNTIKPVSTQYYQNPWLPNSLFSAPYYGIRFGTFTGFGHETLKELTVKAPNSFEISQGLWKDGKPTKSTKSSLGDDLVLESSAQVPGADNSRTEKLSHGGLISTRLGINTIRDFFGLAPAPLAANAFSIEQTSGLAMMADPASFTVESPDGTIETDRDGLVFITNPKSGSHKLNLTPRSNNTRFVVARLLKDGRILWNEHVYAGKNRFQKNLHYDDVNPSEDPVE